EPTGDAAVAEQPGADGLPVPLPPLAQVNPGTPAPGSATGTAAGVPVNRPVPDNSGGGSLPAATDGSGAVGQTQKAAQPVRTQAEDAVVQNQQHTPLFEHKLT
ncbi:hypothetical protein QMN58_27980, partial [Escherichia coli]|nr:hypothetical protein [Escherichia coli]